MLFKKKGKDQPAGPGMPPPEMPVQPMGNPASGVDFGFAQFYGGEGDDQAIAPQQPAGDPYQQAYQQPAMPYPSQPGSVQPMPPEYSQPADPYATAHPVQAVDSPPPQPESFQQTLSQHPGMPAQPAAPDLGYGLPPQPALQQPAQQPLMPAGQPEAYPPQQPAGWDQFNQPPQPDPYGPQPMGYAPPAADPYSQPMGYPPPAADPYAQPMGYGQATPDPYGGMIPQQPAEPTGPSLWGEESPMGSAYDGGSSDYGGYGGGGFHSQTLDDFWAHSSPGFDEPSGPPKPIMPQDITGEFLDTVHQTLYPTDAPPLPTQGGPPPQLGGGWGAPPQPTAPMTSQLNPQMNPMNPGLTSPGFPVEPQPLIPPQPTMPPQPGPMPNLPPLSADTNIDEIFAQIEAASRLEQPLGTPMSNEILLDDWDFPLDLSPDELPSATTPPVQIDPLSMDPLYAAMPADAPIAFGGMPSDLITQPNAGGVTDWQNPPMQPHSMDVLEMESSGMMAMGQPMLPHQPAPQPVAPPPPPQLEQMTPAAAPPPANPFENIEAEDINVQDVFMLDQSRSLLFVEVKGTFALMGLVTGQYMTIKLFEANPRTAEHNRFNAVPGKPIGNQEVFNVQLGRWQGVVTLDSASISLLTEFSLD